MPNKYVATVDTSEGRIDIPFNYGEKITLPQDITKKGYTFDGWYDNGDYTGEKITQITPEDVVKNKYYAKWEKIDNGGNNVTDDKNNNTQNNQISDNIALTPLPQTGEGMIIKGMIIVSILSCIYFAKKIKQQYYR